MTDWQPDPEWAEHVRTELIPMITKSAFSVTIAPGEKVDIKIAVELGLSILLNKPILVVAFDDTKVPATLERIAELVVRIPKDDVGATVTLSDAIAQVTARLERSTDD